MDLTRPILHEPLSEGRVLGAVARYFAERRDAILERALSSRSFELWLNAEFVKACQADGLIAINEVGYATFGIRGDGDLPLKDCADILLLDPHSREQWLFEAALVAWNTQSKWLDKIRNDAIKLRRIEGDQVRRFVLLYCVSTGEILLPESGPGPWDYWLAEIKGDCTSRPETTEPFALGTSGQFVLRLWEVTCDN